MTLENGLVALCFCFTNSGCPLELNTFAISNPFHEAKTSQIIIAQYLDLCLKMADRKEVLTIVTNHFQKCLKIGYPKIPWMFISFSIEVATD